MVKRGRDRAAVRFWGVRGSIASQQKSTARYGGHTPCVSIHLKNGVVICDAGTGLPFLGRFLEGQKKRPQNLTLLLSHLHWDHLFGLPFFGPLYRKNTRILLAGPDFRGKSFKKSFFGIMKPPYFPVTPKVWKADVRWRTLRQGQCSMNGFPVEARWVAHQGETLGYAFCLPRGQRLIYATDHEIEGDRKKFSKWIQGADLLIHDTQYCREEYRQKKGWGHSAFEDVVDVAIAAKVKTLVFFHHHPLASDSLLEKRLRACRLRARRKGSALKCLLAREGMILYF